MARILVIDDDEAVRATVEAVLANAGHAVTLARDGRDGARLLDTGSFDLMVVDLFMPRADGIETIRTVRERAPALPILAMSGYTARDPQATAPDYLDIATKLGATRSLAKPFRARELLAAVDACLAARTRAD